MKRIGVTGASGFIGKALVSALLARGDAVRAFTRNADAAGFPNGVEVQQLDLTSCADAVVAAEALDGLDAVVHLAGETVAGRWTPQKKRQIRDSRTSSTRNLVAGLRACACAPRVLVCASASGYYGARDEDPLTEESPPGTDFLAQVCVDWEREAFRAQEFGLRAVCLRQGLVLGSGGGALQAMLAPFRAGVGGPLGSGGQWWPWIHLNDDVALFLLAIDRDECHGPLNAVSPDFATNARFSQALGHALRRPSLAYAPGIALKMMLGEFADTLLGSQLMLPAKAQDLGFGWKHESLDRTLLDLLDPRSGRAPATTRFETAQTVAADLPAVFEFFSDPANLEKLTPPALDFHVLTPRPIEMRRGAIVEYKMKVRGLPMRWKTLIASWEPKREFVDYQVRGPYLLWRHRHEFEAVPDGVAVRDTVDYALPLWPLSGLAQSWVAGDVRRTFEYRRSRFSRLVGLAI